MRSKSITILYAIGLLLICACAKNNGGPNLDDSGGDSNSAIPNSLHIAFETPDWKRQIDCSHLDLYPNDVDNEVAYVWASSQSTRNTFMLSYPKNARALENPGNIGKFPVAEFGHLTGPFQYAMKLPLADDKFDVAYGRLVSDAGQSDTEFTEITEIKRVGTEANYAIFQIKGRYGFHATLVESASAESGRYVKGTFHLKIRAIIE